MVKMVQNGPCLQRPHTAQLPAASLPQSLHCFPVSFSALRAGPLYKNAKYGAAHPTIKQKGIVSLVLDNYVSNTNIRSNILRKTHNFH